MEISVFTFAVTNTSPTRLIGGKELEKLLGTNTDLPKTLQPLLRQPVISSVDLAPFEAHRKQIQEFLRKNGACHDLFGWVTSSDQHSRDIIVQFMEETSAEFYRDKEKLLAEYDKRCEQHLEKIRKQCEEAGFKHCAELVNLIQQSQPSLDYLKRKIQFRYLRPRIIEVHEDEEDEVVTGLFGQAMAEIQGRAKRAVDAPRAKTQIRAAEEIASKCDAITYIDRRYEKLAKEIREVLAGIPERENDKDYQPWERLSLLGMMSVLSNAFELSRKIETGSGLFQVVTPDQSDLFAEPGEEEDKTESELESVPEPHPLPVTGQEGQEYVSNW